MEKGDRVVLSTDGFADQFGGDKGKKINTKKFKEKLLGINQLKSKEQEKELEQFFEDWKNKQEQTDDVLVFSFKA